VEKKEERRSKSAKNNDRDLSDSNSENSDSDEEDLVQRMRELNVDEMVNIAAGEIERHYTPRLFRKAALKKFLLRILND